jgi:hypothetical protein
MTENASRSLENRVAVVNGRLSRHRPGHRADSHGTGLPW